MCQIKPYPWRRNFSLVVRYSLKFTRRSLLVVKSLVARCKIPWLLVAEVAHCKKSPVTRCKICSLLVHCKNQSLLVADFAPYSLQKLLVTKKSFVTRSEICSLLVAEVARSNKSLVLQCKIHWILFAKNHSLLKELPAGIIVCLKSTKLGESFSFFIIICFLRPKNSKLSKSTYYP